MPLKTITDSTKIGVLGFKAHFSLSTGKLIIDLSPMIWKSGGAASVVGGALIVISPSGRILLNGSTNSFTPPMSGSVQIDLPLFDNIYEWGVYQFRLIVDEGAGIVQTMDDTFDLCAPNAADKNNGKLCITGQPDCDNGVLRLYAGSTKYKGFTPQTWSNSLDLYYPQAAGLNPVHITNMPIEVDLVSGRSVVAGSSIGYFDCGNNYFVTVQYDVNEEIFAACEFPCHLYCAYTDLLDEVNNMQASDIGYADKFDTLETAQHYMTAILFGHKCGKNVSKYVQMMEDLLNCQNQCAPVVIGTTQSTTTTTTVGTTTTTTTGGTTTTTAGTTTTTTAGTTTTTTTGGCPTVTDIEAVFGGAVPLANLYFGNSNSGTVPNEAAILAGSNSAQDPTGNIDIDWTGVNGTPQFLWFAIPTPNTKAHWFATVLNNGSIGTPDDLFGAPTVVNVGGQNYNVYVSNYQTQFSQICQIS